MPDTSEYNLDQMQEATATRNRTAATVAAILLGLIFLVSGGWKILSPFKTGELLEQAQVPAGLGVLGAASLGTVELFAAFLLFVPRFRRWGGLLGSALLVFFMVGSRSTMLFWPGMSVVVFRLSSEPSALDSSSPTQSCCCLGWLPLPGRRGSPGSECPPSCLSVSWCLRVLVSP